MTRPWTEQEVHRLKMLAKKRVSATEIAKMLDRHAGSVKKKARGLSLILSKKVRQVPSSE